jgi:hypothetical protein
MPPTAPVYVEQLSVRARWWLVVIAVAAFGSIEVSAGLGWLAALVTLAVAIGLAASLLAGVGRVVVRVDAGGVHAGKRSMGFEEMESAEGLDRTQTRIQLGPAADPSAYLFIRGYIPESVLIRPLDPDPTPYWLISTRRPAEFVAAVERAARIHLNQR